MVNFTGHQEQQREEDAPPAQEAARVSVKKNVVSRIALARKARSDSVYRAFCTAQRRSAFVRARRTAPAVGA